MASKAGKRSGKPSWMTKEMVDEISKANSRLRAIYKKFGYSEMYSTKLREELSKNVKLTRTGVISKAAKNYDEETIKDTVQTIADTVRKVSDIKADARARLKNVMDRRDKLYVKKVNHKRKLFGERNVDKPIVVKHKITEEEIIKQVNASSFLEDVTQEEFKQYYETWLKLAGTKVYDKALEAKLDEIFKVGVHRVWSDADYRDSFEALRQFDLLAKEVF